MERGVIGLWALSLPIYEWLHHDAESIGGWSFDVKRSVDMKKALADAQGLFVV